MKYKWHMGIFILICILPCAVFATTLGSWTITISGAIMASSCTVADKSKTQSIDLGSYPNNSLKTVGQILTSKDLKISLTGCNDGIIGTVVTLSGAPDINDPTLLALSNPDADETAKGLAIQLKDKADNIIPVNGKSAQQKLVAGDNEITFKLAYKVTALPVTVGNANSVMYLDLAYQ